MNQKNRLLVVIPYYNGVERLQVSIRSVEVSLEGSNYEIHVINNGSNDFNPMVFEGVERLVFHSFDETLHMAENWNRCIEVVRSVEDFDYWYMLHVGDKLKAPLGELICANVEKFEKVSLIVGQSNLTAVTDRKSLLSRSNFPNITQTIFRKSAPLPFFDGAYYPVFDVVALAPLLGGQNVCIISEQISERTLDAHDATTSVTWYAAAFRVILNLRNIDVNFAEKLVLFDHMLRLCVGDFIRKRFSKWI